MKCKKIQDLLVSDYFDGRCSPPVRKSVDEHLSRCNTCRDFLSVLERTSREPFRAAPEFMPPESVWRGIRAEITAGKKAGLKDKFDCFCYGIIRFFTMPKLVAAGVTFALIIALMVSSGKRIARQNQEAGESFYEAAQFLTSLDGANGDEDDAVLNDAAESFYSL